MHGTAKARLTALAGRDGDVHAQETLTARTYHARRREMGLMCLTHNLMIGAVIRAFLQGIIDSEHAVLRFRGERGAYDFRIRSDDRLIYQGTLTAFDVLQDAPKNQAN